MSRISAAASAPITCSPPITRAAILAESYYIAMPALSWQGVVLGDPLCTLGKP